MSDEELMQRMACAVSGIASMALQRPHLLDSLDEGWAKLDVAIRRLRDAPLYISDKTDVTIEQIESQARQMKASGHLKLLCIDYLGLMRMPKMDRHDLAVAHVTRRVKIIAKELQIPVILVFQLNRGSENGMQVRPPRPSDARDSGAIEQDLDAMFLLHRPSYYDKRAAKGLRLDLALQRNGQTGLIEMGDELHCCRFVGGAKEWMDNDVATKGGRDDDL
jgi:replicative DNA helicase